MDIDELKNIMQQYFSEQKNKMQKQAKEYAAAGKQWESELEMKKLGVYDMFGTMIEACALKAKMNPKYNGKDRTKAFAGEYLATLVTISAEWKEGYVSAKKSQNRQEMELEKLRLDTMQEILEQFRKIL